MLVLTRRKNERLDITTPDGTVITIIVVRAEHGVCRLGIEAPHEVTILRDDARRKT
ncbi:MAG TPA: carbon storage regulator [Phycisphaerae bacterium]|nr:carbon storage regulator [Phycisphaerae bacterium]